MNFTSSHGVKKFLIFFLLLPLTGHTFSLNEVELVEIQAEVDINKSIGEVFDFVGDVTNDHLWRTEVHKVEFIKGQNSSSTEFKVGAIYKEDAWLGWYTHFITHTQIKKKWPPFKVVYETLPKEKGYLKSDRTFYPIGLFKTRFVYTVSVSPSMIESVWGPYFPKGLAVRGYKLLMKNYVGRLKSEMEGK